MKTNTSFKIGCGYFLLVCLLCGQTLLHAQFVEKTKSTLTDSDRSTWRGLRLAYDRSILKSTSDDSDLKQGFNGLTVSYVQAWNISKRLPLFVEAGGGLSFSRHSFDSSEGDITLKTSHNLLGLYIPANVVYKISINDKLALKPYTGIYLRLGRWGDEKYEAGGEGNPASDSYRVAGEDGGALQLGLLNMTNGKGVQFGAINYIGYGIDFNKMAPEARFNTFSLRAGLNF